MSMGPTVVAPTHQSQGRLCMPRFQHRGPLAWSVREGERGGRDGREGEREGEREERVKKG